MMMAMRLFTVAMGAGNDAMMAVWEGKVFGERFGFWESCSWAGSAGHGHGATPSVVLCQPASSQHPSPGPKKPPGRQAGGDRAHHGIPAGNLISSPFLGRCPLYQTCTLRPATCGHSHRRTDNSCLIFFSLQLTGPLKPQPWHTCRGHLQPCSLAVLGELPGANYWQLCSRLRLESPRCPLGI